MSQHATYIPAAGRDIFLPLYDPLIRLLMRERPYRATCLEQAEIHPGHRVLDLGCGTGTMAILIRQQCPETTVVGVDGDEKVLAVAREKIARARLPIQLEQAMADHLPFADASFDRVVSSLVFHHLTSEDKLAAMREVRRVLKPEGLFHLADFGPPVGWYASLVAHLFAHGERARDQFTGELPRLMNQAGFRNVTDRGHHNSVFGTVRLTSAIK